MKTDNLVTINKPLTWIIVYEHHSISGNSRRLQLGSNNRHNLSPEPTCAINTVYIFFHNKFHKNLLHKSLFTAKQSN